MKPSVVIVREQLEDREIENYRSATSSLHLSVIRGSASGPYAATGLGLPVRIAKPVSPMRPRAIRAIGNRVTSSRVDLERLRRLEDLVGGARVVVVNETHLASSAQVCAFRSRSNALRVVTVCYENIAFRYEESPLLARRKDVVRRSTDLYLAMSPAARDALIEEGVNPARVEVQPYGVNAARFGGVQRSNDVRRGWGAAADDIAVIFTGRLIREKGVVELVRAIARTRLQNLVLVLVGDGPERSRITRAAATLGVRTSMTDGWVSPDRMATLLASADVFAMPSLPTPYWEEQLGFSAIEAMASGLPVAGVHSASLPFIVGEGGLFSQPYDVDGLARTLGTLSCDPDLRSRLGRAGRDRVEAELDSTLVGRRIGDLIARVAAA